ncbi:hypothetical protein pb186bvf_004747 [Paramecium bursaria]
MNFVSQDGTINTKAMLVCSSPYNLLGQIRVCQKQQYYATYCKIKDYVKFWKNQKIQQIIFLPKQDSVQSVNLNGFLQALLCYKYLRVYFKKKKLITKCQNRQYKEQITFQDNQIILKGSAEVNLIVDNWESERYSYEKSPNPPVNLYDFVRKNFTICNVESSCDNSYEYCQVNDVILIPTGNLFKTDKITIWDVPQRNIINQISVQGLSIYDCEIKMTQSGQYFLVRDYKSSKLYIYSYGTKVELFKKISNLKIHLYKSWNMEWLLDHQYFLLQFANDYKLLDNHNETFDCQLQKQNGIQGKQQQNHHQKNETNKKIINTKDFNKQFIHIIHRQRGQFIDYYSIIL